VTPQEEQLLRSLAERVNSTQLQEKDPDAEAFLIQSLGANADAIYILAQTVLVQNIALERARAQVTQLQQQAEQARQPVHATSFLGSLLGHREAAPAPAAPRPPAYPETAQEPPYQPVPQPQFQPVQQPYQPIQQQYQPGTQYVPAGVGQPSFLRGAMQTAAGVAAGALAFEGVESVLHGFMGHPAGFGFGGPAIGMGPGMMAGGFERPIDETVVNNYYGDSGSEREHRESAGQSGFDGSGYEQGGQERHFHESAGVNEAGDRGGAQLTDAAYNASGNEPAVGYDDSGRDAELASGRDGGSDAWQNDSGGFDDGGRDDSGLADSSGDSGGFDDGGGFGGNDQV